MNESPAPVGSTTVECICGASLRVPAGAQGMRCPECERPIDLKAAPELPSVELAGGRSQVCQICRAPMLPGEDCVQCPTCEQIHHRECWGEMGGCGSYGCDQAPTTDDSQNEAASPQTGWGDKKQCPVCGEQIPSIALLCRYCKTEFDTVDPMSLDDFSQQAGGELKRDGMRRTIVAMFVVSVLACVAPMMALITMVYLLPRREEVTKCGPIYAIMAWTSLGLSVFYTLMLLLFLSIESVS